MFPRQQSHSLLDPILLHLSLYLFIPQEDGPGGCPRSHIQFHLARWAVNTVQHWEQQVLSLPIINYPGCISLGSLTPKIQISITCTILFCGLQHVSIFFYSTSKRLKFYQCLQFYGNPISSPLSPLNSLFPTLLQSRPHSFVA